MKERRKFTRHKTQLKAQYILKDKKDQWRKCTIIDISQKGMGIIFVTAEKIATGTSILLEVPVHSSLEPVCVMGVIKWFRESGKNFIGGIESTELLSDLKLYYCPVEH